MRRYIIENKTQILTEEQIVSIVKDLTNTPVEEPALIEFADTDTQAVVHDAPKGNLLDYCSKNFFDGYLCGKLERPMGQEGADFTDYFKNTVLPQIPQFATAQIDTVFIENVTTELQKLEDDVWFVMPDRDRLLPFDIDQKLCKTDPLNKIILSILKKHPITSQSHDTDHQTLRTQLYAAIRTQLNIEYQFKILTYIRGILLSQYKFSHQDDSNTRLSKEKNRLLITTAHEIVVYIKICSHEKKLNDEILQSARQKLARSNLLTSSKQSDLLLKIIPGIEIYADFDSSIMNFIRENSTNLKIQQRRSHATVIQHFFDHYIRPDAPQPCGPLGENALLFLNQINPRQYLDAFQKNQASTGLELVQTLFTQLTNMAQDVAALNLPTRIDINLTEDNETFIIHEYHFAVIKALEWRLEILSSLPNNVSYTSDDIKTMDTILNALCHAYHKNKDQADANLVTRPNSQRLDHETIFRAVSKTVRSSRLNSILFSSPGRMSATTPKSQQKPTENSSLVIHKNKLRCCF